MTLDGQAEGNLPLEWLTRLRYRRLSTHMVGEILSKPWVDSLVPA